MKNIEINLEELVYYVDIGLSGDSTTDLIRWKRANSNVFVMDIIAARAAATENFIRRMEKGNLRQVYLMQNGIVFTIASEESVQYQLLEALLYRIIENFFETYQSITFFSLSGMTALFEGFQRNIVQMFATVPVDDVVWTMVSCQLCQKTHAICISKRLIQNAKAFPVNLAYLHKSYALLLSIDSQYRVRGTELIEVSG